MQVVAFQPCAGQPLRYQTRKSCAALRQSAASAGHNRRCAHSLLVCSRKHQLRPTYSAADGEAVVVAEAEEAEEAEVAPRDDEILPDSLGGALSDAATSTADALRNSTNRCRVEIIMPEFWDPMSGPIFPEKGDNEKFWKMCRRFVDGLIEDSGASNPLVIFPDMGVCAMCRNWWPDAPFSFAAVNDRRPVTPEHDMVIFAAPDPYGASDVRRIVRMTAEQDEEGGEQRPIVMFNPRLASGDVGIGLNARRMQQEFLSTFSVTYSLQPYGEEASVFRRYPGQWMVFVEDPQLPGRYQLATEMVARPVGDDLEYIISKFYRQQGVEAGGSAEPTPLEQLASTVRSLSSFMKSLSK